MSQVAGFEASSPLQYRSFSPATPYISIAYDAALTSFLRLPVPENVVVEPRGRLWGSTSLTVAYAPGLNPWPQSLKVIARSPPETETDGDGFVRAGGIVWTPMIR